MLGGAVRWPDHLARAPDRVRVVGVGRRGRVVAPTAARPAVEAGEVLVRCRAARDRHRVLIWPRGVDATRELARICASCVLLAELYWTTASLPAPVGEMAELNSH